MEIRPTTGPSTQRMFQSPKGTTIPRPITPTPPLPQSTVTLKKEDFDFIRTEIEQLKKDRNILLETADKRALARYYARNRKDLPPRMKIRLMQGKVIIASDLTIDKGSYQIPGTSKWTEEQTIKLFFQDGTNQEMDYLSYARSYSIVWCTLKSSKMDARTGYLEYTLVREDNGEEVVIDSRFVN